MSIVISSKQKKAKETDKERIERNKQELFNNIVLSFVNVKYTPTYKYLIQFLFSVSWMLLYIENVFSNWSLLLFKSNEVLQSSCTAIVYTLPQLALFYLLFKDKLFIYLRKMNIKQLLVSVKVAGVSIIVSWVSVTFVNAVLQIDTATNAGIVNLSFKHMFAFLVSLFGEEFLFFSAFFLMLSIFTKQKKPAYYTSFIFSGLFACLVFGLSHLSSYDFNVIQCLLVIGLPSMIKILLYAKTKNLFATYTEHAVFDLLVVLSVAIASLQ